MKWIKRYDDYTNTHLDVHFVCSSCGHECFYDFYELRDILTPYCPWCGEKEENCLKKQFSFIF